MLLGRKRTLLLGMVYSAEERPIPGQEYRDTIRCKAVEEMGYTVITMDNKHGDEMKRKHREKHKVVWESTFLPNHYQGDFLNFRRMHPGFIEKFGSEPLDLIILDYFFSPVRILY